MLQSGRNFYLLMSHMGSSVVSLVNFTICLIARIWENRFLFEIFIARQKKFLQHARLCRKTAKRSHNISRSHLIRLESTQNTASSTTIGQKKSNFGTRRREKRKKGKPTAVGQWPLSFRRGKAAGVYPYVEALCELLLEGKGH